MNGRKGVRASLGIVVLLAVILAPPVAADTPSQISDVSWNPRYPIHPANVTISARVYDPDGVQTVTGLFCYIPAWLCLTTSMTDPDGDGLYTGVPIGPGEHSTQAEYQPPQGYTYGAKLNVTVDDGASAVRTGNYYVLFADSLSLTLDAAVFSATPGQPFTVGGSAFYEGNASNPAEGLVVTLRVQGDEQAVTVGPDGSFQGELTAPTSDGTYAITATAQDRTLSDSEEATLAATSTPTPDLTIGGLRTSVPRPLAGPVAIQFDVRNVGTEVASDIGVLVELVNTSQPRVLLNLTLTIPGRGGAIPLVAQTLLSAGSYTVRVSLDPEQQTSELDEMNNVAVLTFSVDSKPESAPPLVLLGAGGVIAVAAVAAATIALRRKGRQEPP